MHSCRPNPLVRHPPVPLAPAKLFQPAESFGIPDSAPYPHAPVPARTMNILGAAASFYP